ncbi:MAG: hypothetical protein NZV14_05500 [Bryobacteraceae bacterium]|nr:hypothetical protein [Bryobacteraceae bacterium]MDW8377593.1 hypothetical protein [Bryobacterales bacterium]
MAVLIAAVTLSHLVYAATYALNADEALHYSLSHQSTLAEAWRMSNTTAHPPLLILVLRFWRKLATWEWDSRLIPIGCGAGFVWFCYGWARLVFGQVVGLVLAAVLALLPRKADSRAQARSSSPGKATKR